MKSIKFYVDNALWERLYRAFPGHGERSALLRKIVRHIVMNKPQHIFFDEKIAADILTDLEVQNEQIS